MPQPQYQVPSQYQQQPVQQQPQQPLEQTQPQGEQFDFSYIANKTRIAVYDDAFSTPRVEEVQPDETRTYIGNIAAQTYQLAKEAGGQIPYTVILELAENFIHAYFKEPVISILDQGNTIRFSDQGPGIEKKSLAQQPGFSSATSEMKSYIRGVGSGLPVVKSYLEVQSGKLLVEDNIKQGTVVTISVNPASTVQRPMAANRRQAALPKLNTREREVLLYIERVGGARGTDITKELGIANSSTHNILNHLYDQGFIEIDDEKRGKYYIITKSGSEALDILKQQED